MPADELLDRAQHRPSAGRSVRVTRRVRDGDELHAVERAEHASVVPAHHPQADQPGAQRRGHPRRRRAAVLTRLDDHLQVVVGQARVHGQREHLAGSPLGLRQVQLQAERGQPVVGDRVVDARADAALGEPAPRTRRGHLAPGSCTGGRRACTVAHRRHDHAVQALVQEPRVACRCRVQPASRPAAPARWRRARRSSGCCSPTISFSYRRSMPWLRSSRAVRASSASPVTTMPPSPEVMFLVG